LSKIDEVKETDKVILELSSFQLMTIKDCPSVAIITNISPNHLDVHKSLNEYIEAKKNIFINQTANDKLILNYDNDITRNFGSEAKGKYVIRVCDGTACHVRKSSLILQELYKELGLSKEKHTTDDMMFTLETVSCLGACGLAPVLTVNDEVHPAMTTQKVKELLAELRGGQA
jgi:UDP-N-acetylmuramoylalanine-D-glutamate ligase